MSHSLDPLDQPFSSVRRVKNRCEQYNMQEIMKKEIYSQGSEFDSRLGVSSGPSTVSSSSQPSATPAAPQGTSGTEDYELYFDSVSRDQSSDLSIGELIFSVTTLNNSQDVKNCVQIHLDRFFFPNVYSSSGTPDFFYYNRVFMEITSIGSTVAVLGPNNNKFHFEFEVQNTSGQGVLLVPIKTDFYFPRPVTSITQWSVRFKTVSNSLNNTWRSIPIPPDRVQATMLTTGGIGYNPARFRLVSGQLTTSVLGRVGATVSPGIAVWATGFASNSVVVDTAINNTEGIYVSNILNTLDFEIGGLDASTVDAVALYGATFYIGKNRIAMAVRFTSVQNQVTNYLTATHE